MPTKKAAAMAAVEDAQRPSVEGVEREAPSLPALDAPDSDYLSHLVKEKEIQYSGEDAAISDFRKLVRRLRPTAIPEKYRHTNWDSRSSALDDELNRLVSLMTSEDPVLSVQPLTEGDTGQMNASKRRRHTEAALKYAMRRAQGIDAWRELCRGVLEDGGGVSKVVVRNDLWQERYSLHLDDFEDDEGYGAKRGAKSRERKFLNAVEAAKKVAGGPPVAIVNMDLSSWYPVWDDLRLAESLEVTERPTHEVLRKYRLGLSDGKLTPKQELATVGPPLTSGQKGRVPHTLKVVEHWDQTWYTVGILKGSQCEIVEQFEHGYGRMPVFFTPGRNYKRGTKHGQSAVDPLAPVVELQNYTETIAINVALAACSPPVFHEMPESAEMLLGETGVEEGKNAPLELQRWELGLIYHGRPGEKFTALNLPTISGDLNDMMKRLDGRLASVSMPRASAAISGDLEGAGFALNQILSEIRAEKSDILDALCNTLEDMTRFYWHLIKDVIGEAVYVEGVDPTDPKGKNQAQVGLAPEDLKAPCKIDWKIDWSQDAAKMVLQRMVHEAIAAGTLDMDQGIEMLGRDPDRVRLGKLADWVRSTNEYKQQALVGVFQQIGKGDAVSQAAQQLQQEMGNNPMTGPAAGQPMSPAGPVAPQAPVPPSQAPRGGMPGQAGMGPDAGSAAAARGRQAPGHIIKTPPGPVRGGTIGGEVMMPRPGSATV